MDTRALYLLTMFFISMVSFTSSAYAQNHVFSSIILDIYVVIDNNVAYVNQTTVLSSTNMMVTLPLIKLGEDSSYEIIRVYGNREESLTYSLNTTQKTLTVYVNQSNVIYVDYIVNNFVEELTVDMHSIVADLDVFKDADSLHVDMLISNAYKAYVVPEGASISYMGAGVRITFTNSQQYTIILYKERTIPPQSSTSSTISGGTISFLSDHTTYYVIGGLSTGIVVIIAYMYIRRRRLVLNLEALPANVLDDSLSKEIILITGDAGENGVKQGDLVRMTGKPKSSISRRVKRLVAEGYLVVVRAGKHNIIKLSDKGREAYRELKKK